MGEHVGEADDRGRALGVVGVVTFNCTTESRRQPPAAGEDATDDGVIDPELTALAHHPLLGRTGAAMDLLGIAGIGVRQDEFANVVKQGGDDQRVAVLPADLTGDALGRTLGGNGMEAESLGSGVPGGGALEEVENGSPHRQRFDASRTEHLDRGGDRPDLACAGAGTVGKSEDGDRERYVGLDRGDHITVGRVLVAHEAQQAVARLG